MSADLADARFAWAHRLKLRTPVVCAPMGGAAGGELAEAVTRAGALGMIGMGSAATDAALAQELQQVSPGFRGFGIGLVDWVVRQHPELLERALDASPALLSVSFGDLSPASMRWVDAAHRCGALTAVQVATVEEARRAEDAGVDLIVARGLEAGGHGAPLTPRAKLLDDTVNSVSVPVLAAGGITTGADLADAVHAGAAGAWVGTAFAACTESLMTQDAKERILTARASDTAISRVADTALGYRWPEHLPERVIETAFEQTWRGRESDLLADVEALRVFRDAAQRSDHSIVPVNAGTGVDRITRISSARDVVAAFAAGLEAVHPSA